jgi:tetratricopeptide (TPR) repeat protein
MKLILKKFFIISIFLNLVISSSISYSKNTNSEYKKEDISNYFLGTTLANQSYNKQAYKYLNKVHKIKDKHTNFNIEFIRTLVLIDKFKEAFNFSKEIWIEEEDFFEADLLLGLNSFINKDYEKAEIYFEKLNKLSRYNLIFQDFIGNVLIAWSKASQGKKEESFQFLQKIPEPYKHLKNIQKVFLQCYFGENQTKQSFNKLIKSKEYNFSRYNYFLANYLLQENKFEEAKNIIKDSSIKYKSNLLLRQTEFFLEKKQNEKIKKIFNCKNPKDDLGEFFYILANLYSSQQEYRISNFYLKISLFLNKKFLPNKTLLAENFFYQRRNQKSKDIYYSIKSIGPIFSWFASKNIASILLDEQGKELAVSILEKEYNKISNPNFDHNYELANFYKDNEYYEKSIKYYSLALNQIKKDHSLFPKALHRRGTSFERLGKWEEAEKDLLKSLEILPDQAHVLNYLAYTWIDKGMHLEKGLEMLKKATMLRPNDGYIIDSLGWAYYKKKNYIKAEFFLQQAVELMPSDPVINDHYADTLWMLNKNVQARYFWNYILKLKKTEKNLKKDLKNKLIFGPAKKI